MNVVPGDEYKIDMKTTIKRLILWGCVLLGGMCAVEYMGRAIFYSYAWHHIMGKATASAADLQQYHHMMIPVLLKGLLGVVLFWIALIGALKSERIDKTAEKQDDVAQPGQSS